MPQITQLSMVFASQLFWLALVFGIIFFGIGRGMLPKIRSTALAREKRIADDLEKAKAAQEQATKTEEEWRARMDAARVEAARVAQKARQESAREFDARLEAALEDIDAKVEAARQRIWTSVQSARAEFGGDGNRICPPNRRGPYRLESQQKGRSWGRRCGFPLDDYGWTAQASGAEGR